MKLFAIAFGIACGFAAVLFAISFGLLTLLGSAQAVTAAAALATLPLTTFPKIAEFLEQERGRKSLAAGKSAPLYDLRSFQIAWPLMVLYGTILLLSVGQAFAGVTGFLLAVVSGSEGVSPFSWTIPTTLVSVLGSYFVGRWIGTRCSRLGVVTMFLVALFDAVAAVGIDLVFMSDELYMKVFGGERLSYSNFLYRVSLITFVLFVPGLLGYWRGRKYRLSKYLHYLLGVLPAETRDSVIDLAYGEAQRVASSTKRT
jgi:hypothetical protein